MRLQRLLTTRMTPDGYPVPHRACASAGDRKRISPTSPYAICFRLPRSPNRWSSRNTTIPCDGSLSDVGPRFTNMLGRSAWMISYALRSCVLAISSALMTFRSFRLPLPLDDPAVCADAQAVRNTAATATTRRTRMPTSQSEGFSEPSESSKKSGLPQWRPDSIPQNSRPTTHNSHLAPPCFHRHAAAVPSPCRRAGPLQPVRFRRLLRLAALRGLVRAALQPRLE